jgi:hypothetical protein
MSDMASEHTLNQSSDAIGADIHASIAALREDIGRLGDDLARLVQIQRDAARGLVVDFDAELQNRIRKNPICAAFMLTFFGYVMGRRHRRRAH